MYFLHINNLNNLNNASVFKRILTKLEYEETETVGSWPVEGIKKTVGLARQVAAHLTW